ncbi:MAG: hypothetical protein ACYDHN_00890 [Solirubrobacteraceae bacterium]
MAEQLLPGPSPRARPIAELGLDSALARAEELAKSWAVALIGVHPLGSIAAVPLDDIAREGPALCAQMLRALQSDAELARLTGDGPATGREQSAPARRIAQLAGAQDVPTAIQAVEALRGVLWEALLEEHRWLGHDRTSARRLAELSDRLASVCACALAAGLPDRAASERAAEVAPDVSSAHRGEPFVGTPAVIVDEHSKAETRLGVEPAAVTESPSIQIVHAERPLSWDESPPIPPSSRGSEIEIRDERREEGPAAWIGSIGRQLERYSQDGVPFAVLLIEPVEIERLRHAEPPSELARLAEQLEEAIAAQWSGSVTRQRPGRYWLIAPAVNRLGIRELAERLQRDLASVVSHAGAPLELAIGSATCPEDGSEASALAAHADVGLYAARSAARGAQRRVFTPVDEPA